MSFHVYHGAEGSRFVGDSKLGPIVAAISVKSGVGINSHARDQSAAAMLHSIGLHTQAEVIVLHARGVPGFGPANPVSRTTHCRYNDGVAYRMWPPGFRIPWWARGIDTRNSARFCEVAREMGWTVTLTYPGSPGEGQHVNLRKLPHPLRISIWEKRPLKRGAKGARVRAVTRILARLGYLQHTMDEYTAGVVKAVEKYQKEHHQKPDGIVGLHTRRQLETSNRQYKKRQKEKDKS